MLHILSSTALKPSSDINEVARNDGEDNLQWMARNLPKEGGTNIVMVGGKSQISFRLRVAQSHVRHDMLPSYWSHVMLLDKTAKNLGSTGIHEISMEPPGGFGFPAPSNGVQKGKLSSYRDPSEYPNIAILTVADLDLKKVIEALRKFQMQRAVLDAVDLISRWLAYVWGISRTGNPLLDNEGIPSAAMLEVVFGAVGYDLTPGLESRSSCPEAIWQAARWWHEYYEKQDRPPLTGAYWCPHKLD